MLFVPVSLFATVALVFVLIKVIRTRDMSLRAHQLFAGLITLYAVQSFLLSLRWGYGMDAVAPAIALLAPCLPVVAYFAYVSLSHRISGRHLWPLALIVINWVAFLSLPMLADPLILATYLAFGALLVWRASSGSDQLALSRLAPANDTLRAMRITGAALIASGLTDVYLIYDFIQNDGQSIGFVVTIVQLAFILMIGLSASIGQSASQDPAETPSEAPNEALVEPPIKTEDTAILAQLTQLFETEQLHKNEDLSLRKIARRLGLPERSVSGAVNRIKGINLSQFVNEFRVHEACKMLSDTDHSVLEISLASGFATKSNFNREFVRVTGQSPSAWRAQDNATA